MRQLDFKKKKFSESQIKGLKGHIEELRSANEWYEERIKQNRKKIKEYSELLEKYK